MLARHAEFYKKVADGDVSWDSFLYLSSNLLIRILSVISIANLVFILNKLHIVQFFVEFYEKTTS